MESIQFLLILFCFPFIDGISLLLLAALLLVSFVLVVRIEIAVLTHPLRVVQPIGMLAFIGQRVPSEQVVAVVAHSLRVVLLVRVRAPSDCLAFPVSSLDNPSPVGVQLGRLWGLSDLREVRFLGRLHLELLQGVSLPLLVKLLVDLELINVV